MIPDVRIAGNQARRAAGVERAREVMRLHDEGLRGDELAKALEVAPGSVRSILTRSRRRLGLPTPERAKPSLLCDVCGNLVHALLSDVDRGWVCEPCNKPTCTYCGDVDHLGPC